MINKQSLHGIRCRSLAAWPKGADLAELVRPAHSRVTRNWGGQRGSAVGSISGVLYSHGSPTPVLVSPEHLESPSRATSALGAEPGACGTREGGRREVSPCVPETTFPTGPCARLHFPQFPLGFRRGGGASDGFRVRAWRCGRGGGGSGGGSAGRGWWERRDRHGRFGAGDRLAERRLPAEVGQSNVSRGRARGRNLRTFPPQPSRSEGEARVGLAGDPGRPDPLGPGGAERAKAPGTRVSPRARLSPRLSLPFLADTDCSLAFPGPNSANQRALAYESSS